MTLMQIALENFGELLDDRDGKGQKGFNKGDPILLNLINTAEGLADLREKAALIYVPIKVPTTKKYRVCCD